MDNICNFCNVVLKNKYNLQIHQLNNKKCLQIQDIKEKDKMKKDNELIRINKDNIKKEKEINQCCTRLHTNIGRSRTYKG